ncbi:MAG: glycosyltransferase family 47 protein [Nitrospira sp.]|nr:glycosyltransferase family 47 protein [Nitrospira sp.]
MKIFLLPIHEATQPKTQGFKYPVHNDDFGVEQDFLRFLTENPELITSSSQEADWHYLPAFWTRWHLNHDYAKDGIAELQRYVDNAIQDDSRTFTVCQYDDGPVVSLGQTVQFLAARKTEVGVDIPVLCSHHRKPIVMPPKRFRASFVGRLSTHSLRKAMAKALQGRSDVVIRDGNVGTEEFVKTMLQSCLALAPRGYGGSSFRFFEAMQLGVAPMLISNTDTRPFKQFLPWDTASIFVEDVMTICAALDEKSERELAEMGVRAHELYQHHLAFQKWCPYVIRTLREWKPNARVNARII